MIAHEVQLTERMKYIQQCTWEYTLRIAFDVTLLKSPSLHELKDMNGNLKKKIDKFDQIYVHVHVQVQMFMYQTRKLINSIKSMPMFRWKYEYPIFSNANEIMWYYRMHHPTLKKVLYREMSQREGTTRERHVAPCSKLWTVHAMMSFQKVILITIYLL